MVDRLVCWAERMPRILRLLREYQLLLHLNATQYAVPLPPADCGSGQDRSLVDAPSILTAFRGGSDADMAAVAHAINTSAAEGQFEVPYVVTLDDVRRSAALCSELLAAARGVASDSAAALQRLLDGVRGPEAGLASAQGGLVVGPRLAALLDEVNHLRRHTWSTTAASPTDAVGVPQAHGVTVKKAAEVAGMCSILKELAVFQPAKASSAARRVYVDVGAGQGDLVRSLATDHGLSAVAVDRDDVQVHGSLRKANATGSEEGQQTFGVCKADVRRDTDPAAFSRAVMDAAIVPADSNPVTQPREIVLCSLHACGALSPNLLRLFVAWSALPTSSSAGAATPECVGVVNLSCCYNLLAAGEGKCIAHTAPAVAAVTPAASTAATGRRTANAVYADFPLATANQASNQQQQQETDGTANLPAFVASRPSLMAACQAPSVWPASAEDVFGALWRRAIAQCALVICVARAVGPAEIGRLRERGACRDGTTAERVEAVYAASVGNVARRIIAPHQDESTQRRHPTDDGSTKRHRPEEVVAQPPSDGDVAALLRQLTTRFEADLGLHEWFAAAWVARALLGELLEAALLQDRCDWLRDAPALVARQCRVGLTAVVPPTVSPRNMALVALLMPRTADV